MCRSILDTDIGVAPAYQTRARDNVHIRPTVPTLSNAYQVLRLPLLPSKTRETAFQVLNRTIWTNNKAYKSKMRGDPNCERCGLVETMEHALCECLHYAQLLWIQLGEVITEYLNSTSEDYIPKVEYNQLNIIYNVPHPSILIHIKDKLPRNTLLLLTQEMKRDIVFRRMNLPPSARTVTDRQRLAAHLDSTLRRLQSYIEYIGLAKYAKALKMVNKMKEINLGI
jgi:hypothetical protein